MNQAQIDQFVIEFQPNKSQTPNFKHESKDILNSKIIYNNQTNAHTHQFNLTNQIPKQQLFYKQPIMNYTYFSNKFNILSNNPNESQVGTDNKLKNQNKHIIIKKPFSDIEDEVLLSIINTYGPIKWQKISLIMKKLNFNRNGRQCRDRYFHYLNPKINNYAKWKIEEDKLLLETVIQRGKKWKYFENIFKGRTEVSLRNRYNLLLRKKSKEERKSKKSKLFFQNSDSNKTQKTESTYNDKNFNVFNDSFDFDIIKDSYDETDISNFGCDCNESSIFNQYY